MGPLQGLPPDVLEIIVTHLVFTREEAQLYTAACAAQALAALAQVCRGTRQLAEKCLLQLASDPAYNLPPCPVTCFPYVWGMHDSSCESGRGIFTLSRHGRPLEWAVVAQEVWRWPVSQVNADDDVWQACLLSLGLASGEGGIRAAGAGSARALPQNVRTLQAVLPRPQALKHSRVPLGFMIEVRGLLCRAIPEKQALRMYQLSAQELQTLPVCKEPLLPQDRSRKGKKQIQMRLLLDVVRLARAKHGTAARMHARQLSKAATAKRSAATRLAVSSRAYAQKEAEARLQEMLDAAGKSSEISTLIRKSFILGVRGLREKRLAAKESGAWEDEWWAQTQACWAQLDRREFLMKHCSAETRLGLAACDWAADKSQGRDIGRLLDMAATLEQTALREWLISFSRPGDALASEGLPASMHSEVELHFSCPAAAADAQLRGP